MTDNNTHTKWRILDVSYLPLALGAFVTIGIVYIVYNQTENLLKERLRERITSIVATASLQFDANEIKTIIDNKEKLSQEIEPLMNEATVAFHYSTYFESINRNDVIKQSSILNVTQKMKDIRSANSNLKYIYLLQLTNNPKTAKFITDADTAIPVDWNSNGKIDEIEYPPLPGEDYDISEIDGITNVRNGPLALNDLYSDKWGTFLSGYAPIYDNSHNLIAILAIDVQVDDFTRLIRATLIPFIILAVVLLSMLFVQTVALVRIWANRVEIVKDLDRQKDELLSIVSHQLATPVSSAKWYLEMLIDGDIGKLNKAQLEHTINTQKIIENMSDLVSMILDVSRIQLGRMRVEKQSLDLVAFFNEINQTIQPKAIEKGVNYNFSLPSNLPIAQLDKRLTRMTIENILSNAIKYTPKNGDVKFIVKIENNTLKCRVSDNGIGIPQNEQDKIFGKLFRASNARNGIDGNGFGLYIAKGAIEGQNGRIWFESKENAGTTFFVDLPLN